MKLERNSDLVLIFLNEIKFEASSFETRTMPTPDMKNKEMIYWIRVDTTDKRLVTDLQRFLGGSSQYIELKVPSAFISVKTELEGYKAEKDPKSSSQNKEDALVQKEEQTDEEYFVEIILRRPLPETRAGQTQTPYG
ncbi:MAG: hypothetical protein ACYCQJ_07300 [Nitrososphaerales archaeon]